ncbi:MAG: cytochrome b/b6 domain-containing protein [Acidimicrobiia bacterium]|nr:cytochrome b/b6 domain-containing protein [Acidimicrobiia bacterium]MDX2467465.1 cytochrome b/b6 domain-containing protein [Acidimicrobiia bacterium]
MLQHDEGHEHEVLRYRKRPRIVHAILASSFLLLLLSGLVILWPALSGVAAGGFTRWLHRVAAVGFMSVPFVYWFADREGAKELMVESFKYDRDDWRWLTRIWSYLFGHAANMPKQGRLNAGQKMHHAAVMLLSASIVVSGLAMWFFMPSLGAAGHAWAAVIHDLSMLALSLLLVGHLYFTFVYKALSGMTTGYVHEVDARLEHARWVEELEEKPVEMAEAESSSTPAI